MLAANSSRIDLAEKFQKLIDDYNAGSQNVEAFFDELKKFAQALTEEEKRGVAEGLTDEELALFDILTKPEPVLTKAEEAEVKKVCRELLETLKREKLVLDWREKQAGQGVGDADAEDGDAAAAGPVQQGDPRREDGAGLRPCVRPLLRGWAECLFVKLWDASSSNFDGLQRDAFL